MPVDAHEANWQFTLNGYAIGTDEFTPLIVDVVADTGTSLVLLPKQIVNAYYSHISGAVYNSTHAGYVFPCGTILPNITFNIGNYNAVVPGLFFEYGPINKDGIGMFYQKFILSQK